MPVPVIVAIISGVTSVIVAAINADWLPVTFRYERWWYHGKNYSAYAWPAWQAPPQASFYPLLISDVPKGGDIHGWSWQLHSRRSGWHSSGRWGRLIRTWFQYMEVIFMISVLGTIIRAIFDAAADPACRDWSGLFPWKEVIKLKKFSFSGIYSERWWYHGWVHESRFSARRFPVRPFYLLVIFSYSTLRRWFSWVQAYLPPLSALLLLSLPRSSIPILMTERPFRAGGGDNHAAFFAGKRLTFRDKCAKLYL